MSPRQASDPGARRRVTSTARRWLGRGLLAGALVAAAVAITTWRQSDPPTILNTEKVERAIEASSLDQRNKRVRVSCPSGVHQKKGLTFSCMASNAKGTTRFVITQVDGAGRVHYAAQ